MIEIKDIQGNRLLSVPITQSCQKVEELMTADYVQLSWNSDLSDVIPVGSYIDINGEKYRLLEPYSPTQKDELEFTYTPKFESRVRAWGKMPFFFYSGISKEPEWTLTSNPADFMRCVCDSIRNESGESWTYSIDASLSASASLSFSSLDILSGLNQIASAFETEWFADKGTNTIYLGRFSHGEEAVLEVGKNISVPSVQSTKEGFYTRFYAFGSTRNITQDYNGANTNNLVNKRLTLDPIKYPNGYKDIRGGLIEGEIFSKVLIFDNVYPSAKLSISDVRSRLMFRLDESGDKIQLGTDDEGHPIYDQYSIWYFRIEGFEFDFNNVIEGLTPSISFQSGALNGREFEVIYYDKAKKITTSDGIVFEVQAGDYEICFIEENNLIIPSMTGLVPSDGDDVVLFNIEMPSKYIQSAYDELEVELDKEIAKLTSDLNNYSFKSNPVAFSENNPQLSIGRAVRYVNGDYSYSTRVIKLTAQLDFPFEQSITIGNEKVKGNTQQLKEEVASANKDLNLLAVFNDMTQTIQQSYNRTQQMMLDGFAAIKNIWQLKTDANGNNYAFSEFDIVTHRGITMYADKGEKINLPSIYDGLPIDWQTIYWENVTDEEGNVIGKVLKAAGGGGLTIEQVAAYLDVNKYATQGWVEGKGYLSSITSKLITDALGFTPYDSAKLSGELGKYLPLTGGRIDGKLGIGCTPTEFVDIANSTTNTDTYVHVKRTDTGYGISFGVGRGGINRGLYDENLNRWVIYSDDRKTNLTQNIWINQDEWNGGLKLNRNTSGGGCGISVYSNGTELGQFGIAGNKRFEFDSVSDGVNVTRFYVNPNGDGFVDGEFSMRSAKINGGNLTYNSTNKYWKLEGDLLVTGGVTMFGSDSGFKPSTIMDAIATDNVNIKVVNGVLTFVGETGGGLTEVYWDNIKLKPTFASVATSGKYSDLSGTPTLLSSFTDDIVSGKYLPIGGGTISSNSYAPITIERASSAYSAAIRFSNGMDGVLGEIGVGGSGYVLGKVPFFSVGESSYELLHVGNYTTHTVKKDGTGATGIWGIGITGNAETATTASKLSIVSKTAWGQTYWTSGGVPTSIDGNMSNVGHITMKSNASFDIGTSSVGVRNIYSNWIGAISGSKLSLGANNGTAITILTDQSVGFGTTSPSTKLHVVQSQWGNGITIDRSENQAGAGITACSNGKRLGEFGVNGELKFQVTISPSIGSSASLKFQVDSSGNGLFYGGVTMYSDIRKKTKLKEVELSLKQIADAPLIEHYYNSDINKTIHVGSIAQYWASMNDWFCKLDKDGYYTMEIQNAALASAISIARELVRYESETDRKIRELQAENKELRMEINELKKK